MTIDPSLAVVAVVLAPILLGLVGWFAKRQVERVEKDLEEERKERAREIDALEKDFTAAIEKERIALNGVGMRVSDLREKVIAECINGERLSAALKPVMDRLGEIRFDIKEIYGRLDGKQDKARL